MRKAESQFLGMLIGAFAGYVLRPAVYGIQKMSIIEIMAFALQGNGSYHTIAIYSIEYMLLGAVIGWFLGSILIKE